MSYDAISVSKIIGYKADTRVFILPLIVLGHWTNNILG